MAVNGSALNAATLAGLPQALTTEHLGQLQLFATTDAAEGVAAFQERRTPRFGGPIARPPSPAT